MHLRARFYLLFQRGLDVSSGPLVGDLLLLVGVIAWAVYTAEGREVVGRLGAFLIPLTGYGAW